MSEKFEVLSEGNILQAAERVIEFCKTNNIAYTEFTFNGLSIVVSKQSCPYDIVRIYHLTKEVQRLKNSL